MILCAVVGKCVSTIKCSALAGVSLVTLRELPAEAGGALLVAADPLGCPQGATVLVASGSAARVALGRQDIPVDHTVIAIVDSNNYISE
jgi:ethanolamine utilization protein EutN